MKTKMKFEDLEAWKESRVLTRQVYTLCQNKSLSGDFGLSNQIKRASISVMANLAEGFERFHKGEKIQFYNIARASAGEVRCLLYVISDTGQGTEEEITEIIEQTKKVSALCWGLIKSYTSKN